MSSIYWLISYIHVLKLLVDLSVFTYLLLINYFVFFQNDLNNQINNLPALDQIVTWPAMEDALKGIYREPISVYDHAMQTAAMTEVSHIFLFYWSRFISNLNRSWKCRICAYSLFNFCKTKNPINLSDTISVNYRCTVHKISLTVDHLIFWVQCAFVKIFWQFWNLIYQTRFSNAVCWCFRSPLVTSENCFSGLYCSILLT